MPIASASTATIVKPGDLRSVRKAYRTSCHSVSSGWNVHMSRHCSLKEVTLPKRRRAAARASTGRNAVVTVFRLAHREMERELVVQVALEAPASEERGEPGAKSQSAFA